MGEKTSMEIIGTNQEEKDRKTKKTMKLITIIIVMLLVISIILFVTIYYLEGQLFKFYIDDKKVSSKKRWAGNYWLFDS